MNDEFHVTNTTNTKHTSKAFYSNGFYDAIVSTGKTGSWRVVFSTGPIWCKIEVERKSSDTDTYTSLDAIAVGCTEASNNGLFYLYDSLLDMTDKDVNIIQKEINAWFYKRWNREYSHENNDKKEETSVNADDFEVQARMEIYKYLVSIYRKLTDIYKHHEQVCSMENGSALASMANVVDDKEAIVNIMEHNAQWVLAMKMHGVKVK